MIKEQNVIEAVKSLGIEPVPASSIIGMIMPGFSTYMLGAVFAAASMKTYTFHFTKDEIIIFGLTLGGKMEPNAHIVIPKKNIRFLTFSKGLVYYHLSMDIGGEKLEYRINKKVIGAKWHKENLKNILNDYKVV